MPNLALDEVVVVTPGDLMGLKGVIVNAVSRHVKKAVKPLHLLGRIPFKTVLAAGRKAPPKPVTIAPDDVAFLQYTGGTTGVAKGAVLLHRNVAANVEQLYVWMRGYIGERPDHVMVTALPLYHIFAFTVCGMLMARIGACQLLIANPRDIAGFVKTLKSRPFTLMSGVNTLYNALANNPGLKEVDFSQVRLCISGGMATQAAVARRWKELTGLSIIEGYGLSETSPVVTANCSTSRSSRAPSAIRCPRRTCRSAAPMTAARCRWARRASYASRVRRSWPAIGSGRTRPPRS